MLRDLIVVTYLITHATIWAWLEVEMEGKYGWAVNLPTSCAFGGWTWYHITMNLLVIMTVGSVTTIYISKFKYWWEKYIATVLIFIFRTAVWFCVEDVMWFVINDSFGILKYTKNNIYWHKDKIWIGGTILLNWLVLFGAIVLGFIERQATQKNTVLIESASAFIFLLTACVISSFMEYGQYSQIPNKIGCYGEESILFH